MIKKFIVLILFFYSLNASAENVVCDAKLKAYDPRYQWGEKNGTRNDFYGFIPVAYFQLIIPEKCLDKSVIVLFKGAENIDLSIFSGKEVIDKKYQLELPYDFIKGNYTTIDRNDVVNINVIP